MAIRDWSKTKQLVVGFILGMHSVGLIKWLFDWP